MATGLDFSGIPKFNPNEDPTSVGQRWKDWLKRFQRFIVAMDTEDPTRKRNLLLYLAGPEVDKIFGTLPETGEEKEKLNEYFTPKKNVLYEIHVSDMQSNVPTRLWTSFTPDYGISNMRVF